MGVLRTRCVFKRAAGVKQFHLSTCSENSYAQCEQILLVRKMSYVQVFSVLSDFLLLIRRLKDQIFRQFSFKLKNYNEDHIFVNHITDLSFSECCLCSSILFSFTHHILLNRSYKLRKYSEIIFLRSFFIYISLN